MFAICSLLGGRTTLLKRAKYNNIRDVLQGIPECGSEAGYRGYTIDKLTPAIIAPSRVPNGLDEKLASNQSKGE